MKSGTRTVRQLFGLDVRYVVPLYQRPYVWSEEAQWAPLWEDILTLLDHQEAQAGTYLSHFLGALVLDQMTQTPGQIPVYTVIDGQQRLTTLQVMLAAASNVAADLGAERDAAIIRSLVNNNEIMASGIELFKVWPTNANRSAFQAVMAKGGPPAGHEDDPENRIDEAYDFFLKTVREWAAEVDGDARLARLKRLQITVCDLLKVVSITLEADDNAQVIFETLNARGTQLLALDLVKNSVFLEAARQKLNTDDLYEQDWRPQLDDDYWRQERRQGRLNRPNADLFLMHWLTMKRGQVTPATELFKIFREKILAGDPPPKMDALIRELCRDARIMRSLDSLPPGSVEATFFERLDILDTSTVLPLMLHLFREAAVTPDRRRRALQMVESWLVRRMLMGLTAKNYNQQIPTIIARVAADPEHADEVILNELRTSIGQISRWPTDAEVRDQIRLKGMYYYISQQRIAMVLAAVEQSLHSKMVEPISVPKGLSIEHVIPQTWAEHWPLPPNLSDEERDEAEAARNARLHRLGNLTLTTGPLNSALSNSAWPDKQKALNANSKLLLNTELIGDYPDRFDEQAIDKRGAHLADRIISIWPGPTSW
jgi:hypothetical protein